MPSNDRRNLRNRPPDLADSVEFSVYPRQQQAEPIGQLLLDGVEKYSLQPEQPEDLTVVTREQLLARAKQLVARLEQPVLQVSLRHKFVLTVKCTANHFGAHGASQMGVIQTFVSKCLRHILMVLH